MADHDRSLRELYRVQRCPPTGMREIDRHADPVHLGDHLATHTGYTAVLPLHPAAAEQRLIVVGELHETYAEIVKDLDQSDVILDRHRGLQAEKDRRAARGARAFDITPVASEKDHV